MKHGFNKVSTKIDAGNGWQASEASYQPGNFLVLVEFNKAGEAPLKSRLDIGKNIFIDPAPEMDNLKQQEVAEQVKVAIINHFRNLFGG